MTHYANTASGTAGACFARILETCRNLKEAPASEHATGLEPLLKTLSPGQMLKVAASSPESGFEGGVFLKALCTARLFDTDATGPAAPEFNAHLSLTA